MLADLVGFDGHVTGFLNALPNYASWKVEGVAIAPVLTEEQHSTITAAGYLAPDLGDRTAGL